MFSVVKISDCRPKLDDFPGIVECFLFINFINFKLPFDLSESVNCVCCEEVREFVFALLSFDFHDNGHVQILFQRDKFWKWTSNIEALGPSFDTNVEAFFNRTSEKSLVIIFLVPIAKDSKEEIDSFCFHEAAEVDCVVHKHARVWSEKEAGEQKMNVFV